MFSVTAPLRAAAFLQFFLLLPVVDDALGWAGGGEGGGVIPP